MRVAGEDEAIVEQESTIEPLVRLTDVLRQQLRHPPTHTHTLTYIHSESEVHLFTRGKSLGSVTLKVGGVIISVTPHTNVLLSGSHVEHVRHWYQTRRWVGV